MSKSLTRLQVSTLARGKCWFKIGLAIALILLLSLSLESTELERLTIMLDWFPNPNHVPLYVAQDQGFFRKEGFQLEILVPADPSDPAKLTAAGKIDLAITTQINLIVARAAGLPLISVGALIQHPLGGLLALKESGIEELSDFKGKRIGYSLEPMEPVLWKAMLECAGLRPEDFELINVSFNTVPALLSGTVEAIGAFRNFEKIAVELLGKETVFFPMEEHCIPDNYELIFVTSEKTLSDKPELLRRFLRAINSGIELTLKDPNKALDTFFKANPDLKDELNTRAFIATLLFFLGSPCHNLAEKWSSLQDFLFARGLIEQKTPLEKLFTAEFLPEGCQR